MLRNVKKYSQIKRGSEWIYFSDIDIDEADWKSYELGAYPQQRSYTVSFSDGDAQVFIIGMYSYDAYLIALLINIVISFLLFMVLTMLGIRRKIQYINQLGRDIEILEGGNLAYEVHLRGNDELTDLARAH